MIAMLSSRCHDLVCPGICPFILMIISDTLFSLVLVFISSDQSLASEMLSSRCHDSACHGIRLSLNCIPATRQTIVTTGHQPHTIPRAHSCMTCSHPELTEDHVLTSAYVKIFRIVTRNAVKRSFWRKKDCSWPPLNKYAMNIWLSSLRIRAHLSWRTGKHLHVLHVLQTYSTCSYPGY